MRRDLFFGYDLDILGLHVEEVRFVRCLMPVAASVAHNRRNKLMTHRIDARCAGTADASASSTSA